MVLQPCSRLATLLLVEVSWSGVGKSEMTLQMLHKVLPRSLLLGKPVHIGAAGEKGAWIPGSFRRRKSERGDCNGVGSCLGVGQGPPELPQHGRAGMTGYLSQRGCLLRTAAG